MESLWKETTLPRFPRLESDIRTDVLIIGGGMAGLLTAYYLRQSGVDCILAEKDRICSGNTENTTAKLTLQHGLLYHKLLRRSTETAEKYLYANRLALEQYAQLCRDIDCDYAVKDNYVYSLTDRRKLEKELEALEALHCRAELYGDLPLPFETAGAVRVPEQAQFDPLKFVAGIVNNLRIYENTFVREMVGCTAITARGKITADRVVCATHFPFINKHGAYFLKLYQHRSYVLALENAQDVDGMYVDENDAGLSFRNHGNLLLLGGGGGRTGKHNGGWQELRDFAATHYPQAQERYFWAAQDCMSLDRVPYIGQYGRRTSRFYVATGFNKWGMTGSMVSALLLSDMLTGRQNDWGDAFDPCRSILTPQLLVNGLESTVNLLTPTVPRCPHLGCALKWNAAEHSWDCPCHGSRFAEDGNVIDNPANGDLK